MGISTILQQLDDEIFYAVLDVVLDIRSEVIVGSPKVYIPARRLYVRYSILCPASVPGMIDRYMELRWKATTFLKTHDYTGGAEYIEQGTHRWEGCFEVHSPDEDRLEDLLVELRNEENRRNPSGHMETDISSATARLLQLADPFHRVCLKLRGRYNNRTPLLVEDEHDVQDLFSGLLETRFEDVRREEWGPSYAGHGTRVDFFLKNEGVLFETKMTRATLTDTKLGDELIVDIDHYKQMPECKAIVCFVYDPDHLLRNPTGLENDLSKRHDHVDVRVVIRPKP